jgi:hypothetical protein
VPDKGVRLDRRPGAALADRCRHHPETPEGGAKHMAERSFAEEVEKLRLGAGATFRGEGILAITKALLENGVGYVGGYQGAPISHLMDVLADAEPILKAQGVRFEASASEAAAAAMLAASVHYPIRGAVTFKATVGTNVAADALANLASGGVTGGALVIVGEDYGEGSSIMQERSHAFAMKSLSGSWIQGRTSPPWSRPWATASPFPRPRTRR